MLTMPSFKKRLIVEQFQRNYLKVAPYSFLTVRELIYGKSRDDASFQTLRESRTRDHTVKCRQTSQKLRASAPVSKNLLNE